MTPTPDLPTWHLIFDDEFSGTSLNTRQWSVASSAPGGYVGCCLNFADQAWSPSNVKVSGGQLHIVTTAQAQYGHPYTSGALTTEHAFTFTYGRIEIAAQLPSTEGLWPAFWLLPLGVPYGALAPYELDFLEAWGGDTHAVNAYFHWEYSQTQCRMTGPDFAAGLHVFALTWSPGQLVWQVDGVQECVVTVHVPSAPMYLLIDTAINGRVQPTNSATRLPQTTNIDYVRVWQLSAGS